MIVEKDRGSWLLGSAGAEKSTLVKESSCTIVDVDKEPVSRSQIRHRLSSIFAILINIGTPFCEQTSSENQRIDDVCQYCRPFGRSSHSTVNVIRQFVFEGVAIGMSCLSSIIIDNYEWSHPNRSDTYKRVMSKTCAEAVRLRGHSCRWLDRSGGIGLEGAFDLLCPGFRWLDWRIQALNQGLPNFATEPSPTVFVVVAFTYRLAILSYYQLRKGDKHQDIFLIGGVIVGIAAGWLSSADIQGILLRFLPCCILASGTEFLLTSDGWVEMAEERGRGSFLKR